MYEAEGIHYFPFGQLFPGIHHGKELQKGPSTSPAFDGLCYVLLSSSTPPLPNKLSKCKSKGFEN
jgi:hypothetical protein